MTFEERLISASSQLDAKSQTAFPLDALFSMMDTALQLWLNKEKTKYIDQKISLLKQWNAEFNRSDRSRMELDNIEKQLQILALAFQNQVSEGISS